MLRILIKSIFKCFKKHDRKRFIFVFHHFKEQNQLSIELVIEILLNGNFLTEKNIIVLLFILIQNVSKCPLKHENNIRLWIHLWRIVLKESQFMSLLKKALMKLLISKKKSKDIIELLKLYSTKVKKILPSIIKYGFINFIKDRFRCFTLIHKFFLICKQFVLHQLKKIKSLQIITKKIKISNDSLFIFTLKLINFLSEHDEIQIFIELLKTKHTSLETCAILSAFVKLKIKKRIKHFINNFYSHSLLIYSYDVNYLKNIINFVSIIKIPFNSCLYTLLPNLIASNREIRIKMIDFISTIGKNEIFFILKRLVRLRLKINNVVKAGVNFFKLFQKIKSYQHSKIDLDVMVYFALGLLRHRFQPFGHYSQILLQNLLMSGNGWDIILLFLDKCNLNCHCQFQKKLDLLFVDSPNSITSLLTWTRLMKIFPKCLIFIEHQSRLLIERFTQFLNSEYFVVRPLNRRINSSYLTVAHKLYLLDKLTTWLSVISKIRVIKYINKEKYVYFGLLFILETNLVHIQEQCLQCLLLWKNTILLENNTFLRSFLKTKKKMNLNINQIKFPNIITKDSYSFLQTLIAILYPRIIGKRIFLKKKIFFNFFKLIIIAFDYLVNLIHRRLDLRNKQITRYLGYLNTINFILPFLTKKMPGEFKIKIFSSVVLISFLSTENNKKKKDWFYICRNSLYILSKMIKIIYLPNIFLNQINNLLRKFIEKGKAISAILTFFQNIVLQDTLILTLKELTFQKFFIEHLSNDHYQRCCIFIIFGRLFQNFRKEIWIELFFRSNINSIFNNLAKKILKSKFHNIYTQFPISEFQILNALLFFTKSKETAQLIVKMVLPMLNAPNCKEHLGTQILFLITNVNRILNNPISLFIELSTILFNLKTFKIEIKVIKAFVNLSSRLPHLDHLSEILVNLNSFIRKFEDNIDYGSRLDQYLVLHKFLFFSDELPILSNIFFRDIKQSDSLLRIAAFESLRTIILHDLFCFHSKNEFLTYFYNRIVHNLLSLLPKNNSEIYVQTIKCLTIISQKHKNMLGNIHLLHDVNKEKDFFENIIHIQIYKRYRALSRVIRYFYSLKRENLNQNTINILVTLLKSMLIEFFKKNNESIIQQCLKTLAMLVKLTTWKTYQKITCGFLEQLKQYPIMEKLWIRILVTIFENFNFHIDQKKQKHKHDKPQNLDSNIILIFIRKICVRTLSRLMFDKTKKLIRVNITRCIIYLIKELPKNEFVFEFHQLLVKIINCSKTKEKNQITRTKNALCEIIKAIGPNFFGIIFHQLRKELKTGYELEILAYHVHRILITLNDSLLIGEIDYCIDNLSQYLFENVYDFSEKDREIDQTVKKKTINSIQIFSLIGRWIQFKPTIQKVVNPLIKYLCSNQMSMIKLEKTREILKNLMNGLRKNPSLSIQEGLLYCLKNLNSYVIGILKKKNIINKSSGCFIKFSKLTNSFYFNSDAFVSQIIPFIEFLLSLLLHLLIRINVLERLNDIRPFIGISYILLKYCKTEEIFILLLKLGRIFIKSSVFNDNKSYMIQITELCFDNLQFSSPDLLHASYNCLSSIISTSTMIKLTKEQIEIIIIFIHQHIYNLDKQKLVFNIINSLIIRRIICHHLYNLMKTIIGIIIESLEKITCQRCIDLFMKFLLYYPVSSLRLKKFLTLILNNINYPLITGRATILQLLGRILKEFPSKIINKYHQKFFLKLVLQRGNEDNKKCLKINRENLKLLFKRVLKSSLKEYIYILLTWIKCSQNLAIMSGKVLYIMIEDDISVDKKNILQIISYFVSTLPKTGSISYLYIFLSLVETIWKHSSPNFFRIPDPTFLKSWSAIQIFIFHKHEWIRSIIYRLIGHYLEIVENELSMFNNVSLINKHNINKYGLNVLMILKNYEISSSLLDILLKVLILLTNIYYQINKGDVEKIKYMLDFYFGKLCYVLLRSTNIKQRKTITDWLLIITQRMKPKYQISHALTILRPLWRISELRPTNENEISLYNVSNEVLKILKKNLGKEIFFYTYKNIRNERLYIRRKRKLKRKIEKMFNYSLKKT